jgi:hypothetical protein
MLNKFILILIKYVYTKENMNKIKLKSGVKNYIEYDYKNFNLFWE